MAAMVVLYALGTDSSRVEELLAATTQHLGWQVPLEVGRDQRVEIPFVSTDQAEGMERVKVALDAAGAQLDVDWTDHLAFASTD